MFFKSAALALTIIAASAGAASAATYAYADQDAKVRLHHNNGSKAVNWIQEGQKVKIIAEHGNWYKIQIPGKDGWVKANTLDFDNYYGDYNPGGSFCVGDYNAQFCLNANY